MPDIQPNQPKPDKNQYIAGQILRLLDIIVAALDPIIQGQYQRRRAQLAAMLQEGRDPTPEEMQELLSSIHDHSAELQKPV